MLRRATRPGKFPPSLCFAILPGTLKFPGARGLGGSGNPRICSGALRGRNNVATLEICPQIKAKTFQVAGVVAHSYIAPVRLHRIAAIPLEVRLHGHVEPPSAPIPSAQLPSPNDVSHLATSAAAY